MVERFESHHSMNNGYLYKKLHDEILYFRSSVYDILREIQPIKEFLINKITEVIKKVIPGSEVKVYGSHATKLCLPWSDIDIAIVPPNENYNANFALGPVYKDLS